MKKLVVVVAVCLFGVTVAIVSLSVRMKYVDANGERPAEEEVGSKRTLREPSVATEKSRQTVTR